MRINATVLHSPTHWVLFLVVHIGDISWAHWLASWSQDWWEALHLSHPPVPSGPARKIYDVDDVYVKLITSLAAQLPSRKFHVFISNDTFLCHQWWLVGIRITLGFQCWTLIAHHSFYSRRTGLNAPQCYKSHIRFETGKQWLTVLLTGLRYSSIAA